MPRGRKAGKKVNEQTENQRCCGGKHSKLVSIGLVLIIFGLAAKAGWSISDLFLLLGAIFLVKGLLFSAFRK